MPKLPSYDPRRRESDIRRMNGQMTDVGKDGEGDGIIVTDFAVTRETIRTLTDGYDTEELSEAIEPMER